MRPLTEAPLHHQLSLLSYDPEKSRLDDTSNTVRGRLLRAAALLELLVDGNLVDSDGKAARVNAVSDGGSLPAEVLELVEPGESRRWGGLIERGEWKAEDDIRDELAATDAITTSTHRVLGIIPTHPVELSDPAAVEARREQVRGALIGRDGAGADPGAAGDADGGPAQPPDQLPVRDLALVVLAMEGSVATLFSWRETRAHKETAKILRARFDDVFPGFRRALQGSIAAGRAV